MKTTVTKRGQAMIPAELRRCYGITEGTEIEWLDTGAGLKVIPVPTDPVAALRGIAKGERLLDKLFEKRRGDRDGE